jgi:hypothetical protein
MDIPGTYTVGPTRDFFHSGICVLEERAGFAAVAP